MICKQCNNNVPNDSEYCPFCGNVVEKVITESNVVSEVDKGYTYLELKEWKKAKDIFDFAIVNNDNKAKAYIGRLLAKFKLSGLESLSGSNKKLTEFDDFKMAVKYADDTYKQQLKNCYLLVEEKIASKKAKSKKRIITTAVSCLSVVVILALSYFVFVPLGRYSYYKKLLSNGNVEKATESFSNSKWFEYNEKVKELFYDKAIKLFEDKEYDKAIECLRECDDYKNSVILYNYYNGLKFYNNQDFAKAMNFFEKSKDYKNSEIKYLYSKAFFKIEEKDYYLAYETFDSLVKKGEKVEDLKEYNFCKGTLADNISEVKHYLNLCGDYGLAKKALQNLSLVEKLQGSWKPIDSETIGISYKNMTINDMGGVCSVSRSISKIDYEDVTISLSVDDENVSLKFYFENSGALLYNINFINDNKIIIGSQIFVRTS